MPLFIIGPPDHQRPYELFQQHAERWLRHFTQWHTWLTAVDNDIIEGKYGLKVFGGLMKITYIIKYTDALEKPFTVALNL